MRKLILCLLCLALMTGSGFYSAAGAEQDASALIVGHTTRMSGSFLTESWGNNTADIDVRNLLHDYPTVAWTSNGDYVWNETVVSHVITREGDFSITHYVTLEGDLFFSDGSPVTAKDFVFSILLFSSPLINRLGGVQSNFSNLRGYPEYAGGKSNTFAGVILVDEHTFALRTEKSTLPNYYDIATLNVMPYPMHVIAPGCDIKDDGEGAYVTGDFTEELLRKTILDPATGYRTHPSVVSGPYTLSGYDDQAGVATFKRNAYYKGNYNGQKPSIENIVFKQAFNDTVISELQNGSMHLLNKGTAGEVIDAALALAGQGVVKTSDYPRTGLSFISFACETGLTQSPLLRQAVARLLDRDEIVEKVLHGYGEPVYGYYGLGQWMARGSKEQLESLNLYAFDVDKAVALLEQEGWVFNSRGTAYDASLNSLRFRSNNGVLEPLVLSIGISERNPAATMILDMLTKNMAKAGGLIESKEIEMDDLLRQYYRQDARVFDMLFLGSNFSYLFDPYPTYHTGVEYQGIANTSGLMDERLMELAKHLQQTPPANKPIYLLRWMDFQRYWVSVLPVVPIYSNTYYDIFTPRLQGYRPEKYYSWPTAILYATME